LSLQLSYQLLVEFATTEDRFFILTDNHAHPNHCMAKSCDQAKGLCGPLAHSADMTSGPGCYSTGWGWTVINILGVFGLSYLVVGVAYQATMLVRAGKPLIVGGRPSWALVPHAIFWVALSGLLRDGLTFTARCGGNGRLGTTKGVVDSNDTQQRGSVTSFNSGSNGKRQSRKDKKKKNSKRKSDLETPLSNTAEPPSVVKSGEDGGGDQAVEWKPTRTGNLSAGARETGVKVQM